MGEGVLLGLLVLFAAVMSLTTGPNVVMVTASVAHARAATSDVHVRMRFEVADAQKLPLPDASVDVAASALVLNFVPDRIAALRELKRVVRPGGLLSFYVWDCPGGGMGFMTAFWRRRSRSIRRRRSCPSPWAPARRQAIASACRKRSAPRSRRG